MYDWYDDTEVEYPRSWPPILKIGIFVILIGIIAIYFGSRSSSVQAAKPVAEPAGREIKVKVSWYWPPLLGTNCLTAKDEKCVSPMANGKPWKSCKDKNCLACPPEFRFGTEFDIEGLGRWTCTDRGGKIKKNPDGTYWVDLLIRKPPVPYGTVLDATVH